MILRLAATALAATAIVSVGIAAAPSASADTMVTYQMRIDPPAVAAVDSDSLRDRDETMIHLNLTTTTRSTFIVKSVPCDGCAVQTTKVRANGKSPVVVPLSGDTVKVLVTFKAGGVTQTGSWVSL